MNRNKTGKYISLKQRIILIVVFILTFGTSLMGLDMLFNNYINFNSYKYFKVMLIYLPIICICMLTIIIFIKKIINTKATYYLFIFLGIVNIVSAVMVTKLSDYVEGSLRLLYFNQHSLIDGPIFYNGLFYLTFAIILKVGYEAKKENDEII